MQSRYYDPRVGRFINTDALLGANGTPTKYNSFAYCSNMPMNFSDPTGKLLTDGNEPAGGLPGPAIALPFPVSSAGAEFLSMGLCGVSLWIATNNLYDSMSLIIDWNGDKNHILKGTDGKHVSGWKKFGFDPNGDDGWVSLLPILKEVVTKGQKYLEEKLPNGGGKLIYYSKYYADKGVEVIVRIWQSADGTIKKISDAWNNIR